MKICTFEKLEKISKKQVATLIKITNLLLYTLIYFLLILNIFLCINKQFIVKAIFFLINIFW